MQHPKQRRDVHCFVLFLWGCFSHLPFSYRCKPLSNSTLRQPILQADVVQSKVEMREILAPVNVSKPVSLVSSAGNQVAPPDSYAMFRHLMETKVIQRRKPRIFQLCFRQHWPSHWTTGPWQSSKLLSKPLWKLWFKVTVNTSNWMHAFSFVFSFSLFVTLLQARFLWWFCSGGAEATSICGRRGK